MSRRPLDPNARLALNNMKQEIIQELGISSNDSPINKSTISSRENGNIGGSLGGTMTRRLIEMAEKQLIDQHK